MQSLCVQCELDLDIWIRIMKTRLDGVQNGFKIGLVLTWTIKARLDGLQ
jgi:hypothetical protein